MNIDVNIPTVGESITEVVVAEWLKADGAFVEMDEIICELESDKATFELVAPQAGTLVHKAAAGDTLEIGATICQIAAAEGTAVSVSEPAAPEAAMDATPASIPVAVADTASSVAAGASKSGQVLEMKIPAVGESITEVVIASWLKKEGDLVEMDEVIAEIESDKATFELTAEESGFLHLVVEEGATVQIGDLVCSIEVASVSQSSSTPAPKVAAATGGVAGHASPAAAKIIREEGKTGVQGTGPGGRVTKADALNAPKSAPAAAKAPASKASTDPVISTDSIPAAFSRNVRKERLSSLRKTIARRLVAVKNQTAMLTTFNEVDMKPIMDMRKKYKEMFKDKHEVGLGFMSLFTKAACMALQEYPAVNAQIDGEEIIYHDFVDISIAVSAPKGLVVPVIRNAESLSLHGIEKEIGRLAGKAKNNKLTIAEMTGGTFTISNGGIFGSLMSTPIINAPQSAVLGMHNIVQRAVVVNGEIVIRPMMYLALSYDHRIIDGKGAVSCLKRMKEMLEDPNRMLLGV